ncbi:MAG: B12-binding domain-containing radical SAM protein [Candidatus Odinarchaeum yellowstonii]|uniref:B12-binding domain-containing radical SAM protein n=1 Tax=Odinarchaeota yellowstonii (strain LCB_4) TaxID=1841599 RepID=A0AAF0D2D2_ODILC|nr:MAG: B12-binding domain-containing radical SAM protein [Candidatus Odinarchaeum yellowstonii]
METDIVLVYPYINVELDRSVFRYPPLGLGYIASSVLKHTDLNVKIVDCTFNSLEKSIREIELLKPRILGIYSMVTINHNAINIARYFRKKVELILAGGPLPTLTPESYLDDFDVVILGEGENTIIELLDAYRNRRNLGQIKGIAYKENNTVKITQRRDLIKNLDNIPFPARELFPNSKYKWYWKKFYGYTATSIISTRGCPHLCDFCSNPVFGVSYRERSPWNVVEEMMDIKKLGYERIFFADDCFTQNPRRVSEICNILIKEKIDVEWMCLSRADIFNEKIAKVMAKAGCKRVFFGIESGNNSVLKIMGKNITKKDAENAIKAAAVTGIETGGFFILGYPGDSTNTIIETVNFSSELPLNYLSYSFPYPIPGTGLYEKVKERIVKKEWIKKKGSATRHDLLYKSGFTEFKLRVAMQKGLIQHKLSKGGYFSKAFKHVFKKLTNLILKIIK